MKALFALALCACSGAAEIVPDAPPADAPRGAIADGQVAASLCDGLPATVHTGPVDRDETWSADVAHDVAASVVVGATLTIAPGATVCIDFDAALDAVATGRIVAEGTAAQPIHIIGSARSSSAFGSLGASSGGTMRLAHVRIESTGGVRTADGTLGLVRILGQSSVSPRVPALSVEDVTISAAPAVGLTVLGGGGFTADSTGLTITGSAAYPLAVEPRSADAIPDGGYTGNGRDAILVTHIVSPVFESTTFRDPGVPYQIDTSDFGSLGAIVVRSDGGAPVTLTVEPGVTLRFPALASLNVVGASAANGPAALVAAGTADRPIVFTSASATPAAGDWMGLLFLDDVDAANRLAHVRVEYAGASGRSSPDSCPAGSGSGAIAIDSLPPTEFVTDSTIAHSAGHGFVRSWASDTKTDFLATNTFSDVALCDQSFPADAGGTCPASPACPR